MKAQFSTNTLSKEMENERLKHKLQMDEKIFKQNIARLEDKLAIKDEAISSQEKQIERLKKSLEKANFEVKDKQREITSLQNQLENISKRDAYKKMRSMDLNSTISADDDLQGVWSTVDDIKKKLDNFSEDVQSGFSKRNQQLHET